MSLWSSVVKYLVPEIGEEVVASTGTVLGARSYLREAVADGAFQKLQRDHAVTGIFEGTTYVNLHWIATQLPAVAARHDQPTAPLERMFDTATDSDAWTPEGRRLRLANGGLDEVTQSWPSAVECLHGVTESLSTAADLRALCGRITGIRNAFYRRLRDDPGWRPESARAQADAHTHCLLHAASSSVWMWLLNRDRLDGLLADGEWLVLRLQRLLHRLGTSVTVGEEYRSPFR